MPETMILVDGYDRRKHPATATFRRMTVYEAKRLNVGDRVPFQSQNERERLRAHDAAGTFRECRVSGRPKTWKTRPGHVRVPIKYGMYENGYAEAYGETEGESVSLLLVRINDD